jgi:hypothetical protein
LHFSSSLQLINYLGRDPANAEIIISKLDLGGGVGGGQEEDGVEDFVLLGAGYTWVC